MRLIVTLLFVVASYSGASAQQWCIPGATWHYSEHWQHENLISYMYTGDTLINGITGQVIQQGPSYVFIDPPIHITRAEEGVIYLFQDFPQWNFSRWDTLIWFDADPGDHWEHLEYVDWACPCPFNVIDTGHVLLEGQWLRTVDVSNPCFSGGLQFRYTERIGSELILFVPACEYDGIPDGPLLRCYSDEDMIIETGIAPGCAGDASVRDGEGSELVLFPNPGVGMVYVRSTHDRVSAAQVKILDVQGRIVARSTGSALALGLNLGHLAPGCYRFVFSNSRGTRSSMIWLKH